MIRVRSVAVPLVLWVLLAGCDWRADESASVDESAKPNWCVDIQSGSDDNDGASPETPFAHAPGDPEATGHAAGAALEAGDTVLFTVGEPSNVPWSGDRAQLWKNRITVFHCVVDTCGYQMRLTNQQVTETFEAIPRNIQKRMASAQLLCEHCRNPGYTSVKELQCPKCGFWFASPKLVARARRRLGMESEPHQGPVFCPNCKVDVENYWQSYRTTRE